MALKTFDGKVLTQKQAGKKYGGGTFFNFVETKRLPQIPNHQPEPDFCREKNMFFWKESSPDDTFYKELMLHYPKNCCNMLQRKRNATFKKLST